MRSAQVPFLSSFCLFSHFLFKVFPSLNQTSFTIQLMLFINFQLLLPSTLILLPNLYPLFTSSFLQFLTPSIILLALISLIYLTQLVIIAAFQFFLVLLNLSSPAFRHRLLLKLQGRLNCLIGFTWFSWCMFDSRGQSPFLVLEIAWCKDCLNRIRSSLRDLTRFEL